ncbi:MAG: class I SAM-dependent methyltransferase [Oscillospiraceae bacterium]|nr:class I SAM-dependent methyltransferase [Oscillospiraceae bacterium]
MQNYTDINARTIDKWTDAGWEWGIVTTAEAYQAARDGRWDVLLTPLKPVPHDWFSPYLKSGRLDGVKLLGLACGGGQQMPIFQALGADCTVLDYSQRQLDREREVAAREGYDIDIVHADMTQRLPFGDNSFDIIFHPVSNVYVEDVYHIWGECQRVLKPGGILLAGMDNGLNFLVEDENLDPPVVENKLPFNPLKMEGERRQRMIDNDEGLQFSHTMEEQIGGQLRVGLALTHLYEDTDTSIWGQYVPLFVATRAVKLS